MKTRHFLSILLLMALSLSLTHAQGFKTPAEGKAAVYFVRVTAYGYATSFEYFHQDKFIGAFKGVNYLRFECNAGENLFWASSENKEFITADVKAGGTYIILVDVIMGAMKAHVGLKPMPLDDKEILERVKEVVTSRASSDLPEDKIQARNVKLQKFMAVQLKKYEEDWKGTRNFKHISPDMAIPEEDLK